MKSRLSCWVLTRSTFQRVWEGEELRLLGQMSGEHQQQHRHSQRLKLKQTRRCES